MGLSNTKVTDPRDVLNYVCAAYKVDPITATVAVAKHSKEVQDAKMFRSMAFYPGDRIAQAEGWDENPDFDPEADEATGADEDA